MLILDFNKTFISEEDILTITPEELDEQHYRATELGRFNIFFVLLSTLHIFEEDKKLDLVAYTSYLISYYLFVPLMPHGSKKLALFYAKKALDIEQSKKHQNWYDLVQTEN